MARIRPRTRDRPRAHGRAASRAPSARGSGTIQTSVFPENAASLALHERLGFRVVGRRERIALLEGVWRDTILLERRSSSLE